MVIVDAGDAAVRETVFPAVEPADELCVVATATTGFAGVLIPERSTNGSFTAASVGITSNAIAFASSVWIVGSITTATGWIETSVSACRLSTNAENML